MRTISLAFTTALVVYVSVPASAQQLPTDAQCHALARERGAGESAGSRNHERFISDCVAGRVSATTPAIPESVREFRAMSEDLCHELARQRGAGESAGSRNHERFVSDCMTGKVARADAGRIRAETENLRKRSEAECDALSRQRGAGETSGRRNHERFVRDCMAGRVP
jgi:hypothetical protein